MVQKIPKATKYLQDLGYAEDTIRDIDRYSIGKMYKQRVQWRK